MNRLSVDTDKAKLFETANVVFGTTQKLPFFLFELDRELGIKTSLPREEVILYGRCRSDTVYSESVSGVLIAMCKGLVLFTTLDREDRETGVIQNQGSRIYEIAWLPKGCKPYELTLRFDTPISMGKSSSGPVFAPAWISEEWGSGSGVTLGIDPDRAEILERWIQKWGL